MHSKSGIVNGLSPDRNRLVVKKVFPFIIDINKQFSQVVDTLFVNKHVIETALLCMLVCNIQMLVCLIYVLSVVIYVGKKLYIAKTLNKTFMLYALQ
jgi:hypothetical protein